MVDEFLDAGVLDDGRILGGDLFLRKAENRRVEVDVLASAEVRIETAAEFEKRGIHVAGLSADDVASHAGFCSKFDLTVELLADPDTTLLKALGVPQSEYKGALYWNRSTFVVDPQGTLRKVYANVNPQGHEEVLLKDIEALQAS